MSAIINVVLPVFGIMLAGYLFGRFRVLGDANSEALNRFVYYGALPALIFIGLARVGSGDPVDWNFVTAFGLSLLASFLIAIAVAVFVFPNRLSALALNGLSANFSNAGYMGIPLLITAFGDAGRLPAILGAVMMVIVVMPVGIVIVELDMNRGTGPMRILRRVARAVALNPLVLAGVAGVLVSVTGLPLPKAVGTFCDILGAAAGPCALFAIGLFMVDRSLRTGLGEVSWLVLVKLAIHPAIAWWLAFHVFTMPPVWAASVVILAALPTGALVFVLAQQYNLYIQRATSVILLSTVFSVVTLSALFVVLGVG
jgi:predicted permease